MTPLQVALLPRQSGGAPSGAPWRGCRVSAILFLHRAFGFYVCRCVLPVELAAGAGPRVGPEAKLRHEICLKYETRPTRRAGPRSCEHRRIDGREARHFLAWQLHRGVSGEPRKPGRPGKSICTWAQTRERRGLRRKSLKDSVAERLCFAAARHAPYGPVESDLAAQVIVPLLYAYEGVPSTLDRDQIAAVLETTKRDTSPIGLRDYEIRQLLATYGLRSGEIRQLAIEDIDWRAESLAGPPLQDRCMLVPAFDCCRPSARLCSTICAAGVRRPIRREVFIRSRAPLPSLPCTSTARSAVGCGMPVSSRRGNADLTLLLCPGGRAAARIGAS